MKNITLIFAVALLISSCTTPKLNDPIQTEGEYVNRQIQIRAPAYANKFNTRDVVILELRYNSTNEIVFHDDYGLRIFEKVGDGWIEIKQKPTDRVPSGDIILSPRKEISAVQVVMLFPDLPDLERKYLVRIYVIGQMNSDGGKVEVVAFTDIVLQPK